MALNVLDDGRMYTLALDTTNPVGGLALLRDRAVAACLDGDPGRTHGERLPGDILRVLETTAVRLRDIDLYAVARGPGGFTGLRVGMATIQALALVHARPVVAVSALEAAARGALVAGADLGPDDLVGVWLDAHRGEVFSALYGQRPSGVTTTQIEAIDGPGVDVPAPILARWRSAAGARRVWLAGGGARRYRTEARRAGFVDEIAVDQNLAAVVGIMAVESARRGATQSPHELAPLYIRRPDAELARQRRAVRSQP